MPRASKEKKKANYNNGGGQTQYKASAWERGGVKFSAPRSRKTPCTVGWTPVAEPPRGKGK